MEEYKGCIESQRLEYNRECVKIISDSVEKFPLMTFKQILLNLGLFDDETLYESNLTLSTLKEHYRQLSVAFNKKG